MDDQIKPEKITDLLRGIETVPFDKMPDLGLYMDQVTGFLNRLLRPFTLGRDDAPLTPSMINNYVKSGHISRPTKKKYSREQIAALYMLCSLKKTLSITDAAALIYFLTAQDGSREAYTRFIDSQTETMQQVSDKLIALGDEPTDEELTTLALDLVQHACAERLAAEAIISALILRDDTRKAREAVATTPTEPEETAEDNGETEE